MSAARAFCRRALVEGNLWLLFLLVPLAVVARHVVDHPLEKERITSHVAGWTNLELQSVNDLVLKRAGQSLRFQKNTDGAWIMTAPEFFPANQIKVHNILSCVMYPRVERRLEAGGELEAAFSAGATLIEVRFDQKLVAADFLSLPGNEKYDYIRYHGEPGRVYKVEREAPPDLSLQPGNYRTMAIFPFALAAVKRMTYSQGGKSVAFASDGGMLKTEAAVDRETWENAFKKWEQAGCHGHKVGVPVGPEEAAYEFEFASGDLARLALHVDTANGLVVHYEGRQEGQLIDARTRDTYFPRL